MNTSFDIEGAALHSCTLRDCHLVIPDGVTEIADGFAAHSKNMYYLTSLVIPQSVVRVGDGAFCKCHNLRKVTVLGAAEIGSGAFSECRTLKTVWLADGVSSLGDGCFDYCENLAELFIPQSVKKIDFAIARQYNQSRTQPRIVCETNETPAGWAERWNFIGYDNPYGGRIDYEKAGYHKVTYGRRRPWYPSLENALQPCNKPLECEACETGFSWSFLEITVCHSWENAREGGSSTLKDIFSRSGSTAEKEYPVICNNFLPYENSDWSIDSITIAAEKITCDSVTLVCRDKRFVVHKGENIILMDNPVFGSKYVISADIR